MGNSYYDFIMMDPSSLYASSRNFSDQYGNIRLDIDDISYEVVKFNFGFGQELLAQGERIGNVNTGLSEDMTSKCLTETKIYSDRNNEERTCCICLTRNATGLVAPAIAVGLGVLTHTSGTLVPVIGASGFVTAAAATTIGTVVDSFR
ncbi:hypothetical protein CsSME_00044884 [Camellia sinensis var. sinensis]